MSGIGRRGLAAVSRDRRDSWDTRDSRDSLRVGDRLGGQAGHRKLGLGPGPDDAAALDQQRRIPDHAQEIGSRGIVCDEFGDLGDEQSHPAHTSHSAGSA
ncbi:hypothetical protein GCM10022261_01560 [Brevibacterium daeguense]|uniref:Uncharacterized protein n=1 Tax=Brevibacterium daeguense TaxID=909936 RepID=A0ABP8EFA0_9MICO